MLHINYLPKVISLQASFSHFSGYYHRFSFSCRLPLLMFFGYNMYTACKCFSLFFWFSHLSCHFPSSCPSCSHFFVISCVLLNGVFFILLVILFLLVILHLHLLPLLILLGVHCLQAFSQFGLIYVNSSHLLLFILSFIYPLIVSCHTCSVFTSFPHHFYQESHLSFLFWSCSIFLLCLLILICHESKSYKYSCRKINFSQKNPLPVKE